MKISEPTLIPKQNHKHVLAQCTGSENLSNKIDTLIFSINPGIIKFNNVLVFQSFKQMNF